MRLDLEAFDLGGDPRRPQSYQSIQGRGVASALRRHVLVQQLLSGPTFQQHELVGIVEALEQLVLLAAVFLLRNRLHDLKGVGEVSGLARHDMDRDDVTNSQRFSSSTPGPYTVVGDGAQMAL